MPTRAAPAALDVSAILIDPMSLKTYLISFGSRDLVKNITWSGETKIEGTWHGPWTLPASPLAAHWALVQGPWDAHANTMARQCTIHGRSDHDPWPLVPRSMAARTTIHGRSYHGPRPLGPRSPAARTTIQGCSDHDPWPLVPRDPARLAVARGRPVDGEAWHMVREPRRRVVGTLMGEGRIEAT